MIHDGGMPEGWDSGRPSLRSRRTIDRHPKGVAEGDPVGGRECPAADRRIGRPGDFDEHEIVDGGSVETGTYGGRNLHFGDARAREWARSSTD